MDVLMSLPEKCISNMRLHMCVSDICILVIDELAFVYSK